MKKSGAQFSTLKAMRLTLAVAWVAATVLLAGCAAFPLGQEPEKAPAPSAPIGGPSYSAAAPRMIPATFADVAQVASPAVVNISAIRTARSGTDRGQAAPGDFFGDLFRWFSGENAGPRERRERSLGSGFLVNANGLILTNDHVVANAEQIVVRMLDQREYQARVLGRDPKTDLALIKIDAGGNLPYLSLGDSDRMRIGDWVLAIGNPFGLDHTVTSGIISGRGRAIGAGPYDSFLQTDASINPGNSGGPLLNLNGEVIGIATAILAQGQGIGFAIPANLARGVIRQLESRARSNAAGWGSTIRR